jgi:hypothetical protein
MSVIALTAQFRKALMKSENQAQIDCGRSAKAKLK